MPCEAYSLVHSSKNCLQGLLDTLVTLTIQKPLADSCSGEIRVPQEHILLPAVAGILEFACVISAVSTGLLYFAELHWPPVHRICAWKAEITHVM